MKQLDIDLSPQASHMARVGIIWFMNDLFLEIYTWVLQPCKVGIIQVNLWFFSNLNIVKLQIDRRTERQKVRP